MNEFPLDARISISFHHPHAVSKGYLKKPNTVCNRISTSVTGGVFLLGESLSVRDQKCTKFLFPGASLNTKYKTSQIEIIC